MRIPRGLLTLFIISAVVGSALLGQQRWREDNDDVVPAQTEQPGYSARDAEIIETGVDGRPLYRLDAAEVHEQPKDGSVRLDRIHMTYRGENTNQWSLTAATGTVRDNNEHVELSGDVLVMGVLAGSSDLAQIRTEQLSFDTSSQIATTDQLATLRLGKHEIHGTGLFANLKDQRVQLKSDVHGQFSR